MIDQPAMQTFLSRMKAETIDVKALPVDKAKILLEQLILKLPQSPGMPEGFKATFLEKSPTRWLVEIQTP